MHFADWAFYCYVKVPSLPDDIAMALLEEKVGDTELCMLCLLHKLLLLTIFILCIMSIAKTWQETKMEPSAITDAKLRDAGCAADRPSLEVFSFRLLRLLRRWLSVVCLLLHNCVLLRWLVKQSASLGWFLPLALPTLILNCLYFRSMNGNGDTPSWKKNHVYCLIIFILIISGTNL